MSKSNDYENNPIQVHMAMNKYGIVPFAGVGFSNWLYRIKTVLSEHESLEVEKDGVETARSVRPENKKFQYECYNCGKKGHMKSECRFKRKNVGRLGEDRKKEAHVKVEEEGEIAFIASANNIMSTTTQEEIEFIADSGATDHLINDEVYFNGGAVDLEKPIRINVAKEGESLIATKVGTITTTICKLEKNSHELAQLFELSKILIKYSFRLVLARYQ
ncbi:hypothetical protein JTB14_007568 [Gonioctena quinquepunctata]|nr:hypothetical protein JTB14_007568 [Gonioctena quinquepunctata]